MIAVIGMCCTSFAAAVRAWCGRGLGGVRAV